MEFAAGEIKADHIVDGGVGISFGGGWLNYVQLGRVSRTVMGLPISTE